jgi:predicted DCC family thiol-disulfide oxidoreductase YuxK
LPENLQMENINHIILFDGVCNLCNGAVQFVIKRDKEAKFKFASLQSPAGQALLRQYNLPVDHFYSFVYIRKDQILQRSSAALYVLRDLGSIWKFMYGFIVVPKFIRDFVYNSIARYRYKLFGKRDSCMIPTLDLKKRFLE